MLHTHVKKINVTSTINVFENKTGPEYTYTRRAIGVCGRALAAEPPDHRIPRPPRSPPATQWRWPEKTEEVRKPVSPFSIC